MNSGYWLILYLNSSLQEGNVASLCKQGNRRISVSYSATQPRTILLHDFNFKNCTNPVLPKYVTNEIPVLTVNNMFWKNEVVEIPSILSYTYLFYLCGI